MCRPFVVNDRLYDQVDVDVIVHEEPVEQEEEPKDNDAELRK